MKRCERRDTSLEKSRYRAKDKFETKMSNKVQNKMNIHESILIGVNILNKYVGGRNINSS